MLAHLVILTTLLAGGDGPMTNRDVVELVEKGLSPGLVIAMIQNAKTDFHISTEAVLELREAGVPDEVLEAMIGAQGPPDLSDDGVLMVYVSDSQSWQISGGFGAGEGAGVGYSTGGARPQTAEIIKTFEERCPELAVTNEKDRADYVVLLDHEGGKSLWRRDNKVVVFGRDGISIHSQSTRSLGNAVKGACAAIRQVESQHRSSNP